jgi:hypothetical protein
LQAAERELRLIWHDPNGLRLLFGSWVKVVYKLRRAERICVIVECCIEGTVF